MKQIFIVSTIILTCHFGPRLNAQDLKKMSYDAYLNNDLNKWKSIILKTSSTNKTDDKEATFDLAFAQFGLLSASMVTGNEDLFDQYVKPTHSLLNKLMDSDASWAEPKAVSSFIMGYQIANSPIKAIYLGSKSSALMGKAIKQNNKSPLVMQLYAGSKYFSPKIFGGDLNEAIENYTIAIQLFEQQKRTNEWLYLDAMAYLGRSYMRNGEAKKAIEIYKKALGVEPNFYLVKNYLLPKAQAESIN